MEQTDVVNAAKSKCSSQSDSGYNTVLHPFVHQVSKIDFVVECVLEKHFC